MQVVPSEMSCHIDYLTGKIKAGDLLCLHCLDDSSLVSMPERNLCLTISPVPRGLDPVVKLMRNLLQLFIIILIQRL